MAGRTLFQMQDRQSNWRLTSIFAELEPGGKQPTETRPVVSGPSPVKPQ